jgi:hypothetical protein
MCICYLSVYCLSECYGQIVFDSLQQFFLRILILLIPAQYANDSPNSTTHVNKYAASLLCNWLTFHVSLHRLTIVSAFHKPLKSVDNFRHNFATLPASEHSNPQDNCGCDHGSQFNRHLAKPPRHFPLNPAQTRFIASRFQALQNSR